MSTVAKHKQTFVGLLACIALWISTTVAAFAAGIGGGAGGFAGGGAGFSGGAAGVNSGIAGFGVAPRVPSPVTGVPLPPVGYDGSRVGPSTNSRTAPKLDPQLPKGPGSSNLYKTATPGPRFDQGRDPSVSASSGGRGHGGILPPDGSGYLVVEDGAGGATIYGPTGVRRVKNFDPSRLRELTTP